VTAAVSAGNIEGPREETSLVAFLSILLAHRRTIAICGLLGTFIFGVFAIAEAKRFESQASFIVKGAAAPVALPNTASSFGLVLTAHADFAQSVVFYSDLAGANVVLNAAAAKSYATSTSHGAKRPLPELLGIKEKNPSIARDRAIAYLKSNVSTSINTRSGVVSISIAAGDPLLAQGLAATILHEIEMWSRTRAHADAVQERQFTQSVADDAKARLAVAEQNLETFLATNASYGSPELTIEHDRLARDVSMRQEVYTALANSLEQAKIEEGRDHSAINIVEVADLPVEPQRAAALRKILIGLASGLCLGMMLAFVLQRMAEKRLLI
jgi:uncharacterized protein involved in exopolysaccharide biosynthesis